jgi:hypothetical protein
MICLCIIYSVTLSTASQISGYKNPPNISTNTEKRVACKINDFNNQRLGYF